MICDRCKKHSPDVVMYKIRGRLVALCADCEAAMEDGQDARWVVYGDRLEEAETETGNQNEGGMNVLDIS